MPAKPSTLIDHPKFFPIVWSVLVFAVSALVWTGKTAWDANQRLNELREQARKDAASDTARELSAYLTQREWLTWQLAFEEKQRARDREMVADLRRLVGRP